MKKILQQFMTVASLSLLFGCANSPQMRDNSAFERVPLTDDEEIVRVSYLARYMIEEDERAELVQKLRQSESYKSWQRSDSVTGLMAASDLTNNTDSSLLGNKLATGIAVGGFIWDSMIDGSMDRVSQAFLPEVLDGDVLDTAEKAHQALVDMLQTTMKEAADSFGWQLECVHGCNGANQVYLVRNVSETLGDYPFKPTNVCMQTHFTTLKPVKELNLINSVLDFKAGWATADGNTFVFNAATECKLDSEGKLELGSVMSKGKEVYYPEGTPNSLHLLGSRLGRDFYKKLFSNPYWTYGNQKIYPKVFFYNGKAYSFILNSNALLIKKELINTSVELEE